MLLLFWLLPSLITLWLWIIITRVLDNREPRDYDGECWSILLGAALLYPLGLFVIILGGLCALLEKPCKVLSSMLSKEIKFKWRK
jgi:hypothetical protein